MFVLKNNETTDVMQDLLLSSIRKAFEGFVTEIVNNRKITEQQQKTDFQFFFS